MTSGGIVCFGKDWDDDPTSNTHVMRELAADRRVLWLESIGMRAPRVASSRDLRRIGSRLRQAAHAPRRVAPNLWVASPVLLPLPHSERATALNRALLRLFVRRLARRLDLGRYELWTFLPNTAAYADALDPELVVYYCVDNWAASSGYDGTKLAALEQRLCRRADVVFGTSRSLVDARRSTNAETHLAAHGVDHAHFARALAPDIATASEVAALRAPVLGVVGLLDDRIDVALLDRLAGAHPEWTIALVGTVALDASRLARHANVRLLGRQPYARLPELLRGFAVGLVPFVVDDYTRAINPVKAREYLSAGLPVVGTALPELATLPGATAAADYDDFVAAIARAVRDDAPARRADRSAAMAGETWAHRVAALRAHVARVREARAA
jgi:glycosyltransferase involved in cell wall biosynthesis